MTTSSFDGAASSYDNEFTNTSIGRKQRDHVWSYLQNYFNQSQKKLEILEINCGTGEDAIWMAKQGHQVLATDVSKRMLEESNKKLVIADLDKKIKTKLLDLTNTSAFQPERKFDFVFSNFGGLNCLSLEELSSLSLSLKSWVNDDAKMIFVIMPKHTQLDSWYRLLKFKWTSRKERRSGFTKVNLNGVDIPCYYHNLEEIKNAFHGFQVEEYKSIGFLPSYFESFAKRRPTLFKYLLKYENRKLNNPQSVNQSDHYLITLKKLRSDVN